MNYIIGTRGSPLALRQSLEVADLLGNHYPQHQFTLQVIRTLGDINQTTALDKMQDKGIFVKEIEEQLLSGKIHLAVHSMKDMPSLLPEGLCFAQALKGEDARDVFVSTKYKTWDSLPLEASIATGSKRRSALLLGKRADLEILPIRGNIDTRLAKMEKQDMDGMILAAAGLHRLGKESRIREYLDPREFVPACCQGILAIELKSDQKELLAMLNVLHDPYTQQRVLAERAFLQRVDGGCHSAVGAYLEQLEEGVCLHGLLGSEDDTSIVRGKKYGTRENLPEIGIALAEELLEKRECKHNV